MYIDIYIFTYIYVYILLTYEKKVGSERRDAG